MLTSVVVVACSSSGDDGLFNGTSDEVTSGGRANGGSLGSGAPGSTSGGRANGSGGAPANGGTSTSGGEPASEGGSNDTGTGGTITLGGRPNGGRANGGRPNGGRANGGRGGDGPGVGGSTPTTGGSSSGGTGAAGTSSTGGAPSATGGASSGGTPPVGTGGSPSMEDCQELRAAASEALEKAQACQPAESDQCAGFVQGECCPVPVNDPQSEASATFVAAIAKWKKTCGEAVCLTVLCVAPSAAECDSQGSGPGRCVPRPGLSF